MKLRRSLIPMVVLAAFAIAPIARAGVGAYPSPLYLSGTPSAVIGTSNALISTAGPAAPTTAPTVSVIAGTAAMSGSYSYVYTVVDPVSGETPSSPTSATATTTNQPVRVAGLPTGVTVYVYRKLNDYFRRVAELTSNASATYDDSLADTTASGRPVLSSTSQIRIGNNTTGYQSFNPGRNDRSCCYLPLSTDSPNTTPFDPTPATPSGRGWLVDGPGNVSFPTGTWTFTVKLQAFNNAPLAMNRGVAHLVVGMWKVQTSGGVITSSEPLVDPTTAAAENGTNFITNIANNTVTIAHQVTVNTFGLKTGERLYVQFWRKQTTQMVAGNVTTGTATLYGFDGGTTQITHPAANAAPSLSLAAIPARVNSRTPNLVVGYGDPEHNSGTVSLKLCSAPGCADDDHTTLQTSGPLSATDNANVSWMPATLDEGATYYLDASATDSSGAPTDKWTTSFVVDTIAPNVPALTSGTRAKSLTATFTEPDTGDPTGTVTFQLCSTSACSTVPDTSTTGALANGAATTWTPAAVTSGMSYYWRARAQDGAGNVSAWSTARAFVFDNTAPAAPTLTAPAATLSSVPTFSAKYNNSDSGDSGQLEFQVCSDQGCATVRASGTSGTLTNNAVGTWTPASLSDGTLWVRVRALDLVGNTGDWSSATFYLDATPPATPTLSGIADGARVTRSPSLGTTFSDAAGHAGMITIQVCSDASCNRVVATTTRTSVANGGAVTWDTTLADGKYFLRALAADDVGNQSWSPTVHFWVDTTPPAAPALLTQNGLRARSTPILVARAPRSDDEEIVRVAYELCSDETCATVIAREYVTAETAQWQPPALPEGTYFWRAFAIDGAALESGWSALRAFAIDTTPPAVPTLAPGVDRPVRKADLVAASADGDATAITFQLCSDADCTAVLASTTVFGAAARWSTELVDDGTYYWRAAAADAAGNVSAWSSTQQLTADVTPPAQPRAFDGDLKAKLLSLRWKAPKDAIRGYVVYVNGKRWRTLSADTLGIDVRLRAGDRRSFAIAAIDATGNIGQPTRSVVLVPQLMRMTLAQAKKAAATQGLLLRYSKRTQKTPQRIVEQSPAAETLVSAGTVVTVVVDGLARSAR